MASRKYSVVLADPPWLYDNAKSDDPKLGGKTYPQMTMEDLFGMKDGIDRIVAPDCGLFMWATLPKLPEALSLMEAWDFKFTTVPFVWVKINPNAEIRTVVYDEMFEEAVLLDDIYSGLGHWTNGNAEIVLFGKRGKPKRDKKNIKQIVIAPRGRHSAKPEEVRSRITALMGPGVKRVELFAREKARGWSSWGNEVDAPMHLNAILGSSKRPRRRRAKK